MDELPKVEIVQIQNLGENEPEQTEVFEGDTRQKVATSCPQCGHTTAYLNGSVRKGAQFSGPSHIVQYTCAKCDHTWSLGY